MISESNVMQPSGVLGQNQDQSHEFCGNTLRETLTVRLIYHSLAEQEARRNWFAEVTSKHSQQVIKGAEYFLNKKNKNRRRLIILSKLDNQGWLKGKRMLPNTWTLFHVLMPYAKKIGIPLSHAEKLKHKQGNQDILKL